MSHVDLRNPPFARLHPCHLHVHVPTDDHAVADDLESTLSRPIMLKPSHQHIVGGFQERDTSAAGTMYIIQEATPLRAERGQQGFHSTWRQLPAARLRDLLEGRRRPPRDDHSGTFHIMAVRRLSAPLFLTCCLDHRDSCHSQQQ